MKKFIVISLSILFLSGCCPADTPFNDCMYSCDFIYNGNEERLIPECVDVCLQSMGLKQNSVSEKEYEYSG